MELLCKNLSAGYPRRGVQGPLILAGDISFEIKPGQLTLLLGENGSGKSTLLKTLSGIIPALSGQIVMNGTPLAKIPLSELAKQRAFVPGGWIDPGPMTLYEFTALGRIPWGKSDHDDRIIRESLELAELAGREKEQVNCLSDGEKQKGKIARALCQDTPLLYLDEPESHLDVRARENLLTLLKRCIREKGKSILFSSHDLTSSLPAADRILFLERGDLSIYERGELSPEEAKTRFRGVSS